MKAKKKFSILLVLCLLLTMTSTANTEGIEVEEYVPLESTDAVEQISLDEEVVTDTIDSDVQETTFETYEDEDEVPLDSELTVFEDTLAVEEGAAYAYARVASEQAVLYSEASGEETVGAIAKDEVVLIVDGSGADRVAVAFNTPEGVVVAYTAVDALIEMTEEKVSVFLDELALQDSLVLFEDDLNYPLASVAIVEIATDEIIVGESNGEPVDGDAEGEVIDAESNAALEITKQPEDFTGSEGSAVTFEVTAEGDGLTYQWQWLKAGTTEWRNSGSTGATTAKLSGIVLNKANTGNSYRCIVKDSNGGSVTSAVATMTIQTKYTIDGIVYEVIDDVMKVVGYEGTASSYTVLESVDGITVKEIAESAFEGNTYLVSIDLPDTIEVIGKRAFANCTNLSSMK